MLPGDPIYDAQGQQLSEGDRVAYAALWGRSATLNVGIIEKIQYKEKDTWREEPTGDFYPVIKVKREIIHGRSPGAYDSTKPVSLKFPERIVKL